MSNSSLISYTKISPNKGNNGVPTRLHIIDKETPHHMAGNLTIERCGEGFGDPNRKGSSNYGIGSDGRIGLYVDECDRAWTSGNRDNDNRAVTIEVANDGGAPDWHISDLALESLINLSVDICQRNGIKALNYTGDSSGNLTRHNMFEATTCPGSYLQSKFPYIQDEVNKRLGSSTPIPKPQPIVENLDVNLPTNIFLKRGSIGLNVKILQFNLNKILGCKLLTDGEFGDKTYDQVVIFQGKFKLTKDGKVGQFTATKINEVRNKRTIATAVAQVVAKPTGWVADLQTALNNAGYRDKNGKKLVVDNQGGLLTLSACPTLSRGSKNAIVGILQARLNSLGYVLTRDNDFGQKTHDAVILFQRAKGLKQDGIVGTKTWAKLLGL